MKVYISILLVGISAFAFKNEKSNSILKPKLEICDSISYEAFKTSIIEKKIQSTDYISKSNYLFSLISNDIYCYWKGTGWDYYGKTQIPNSGKIACGYFVTNTLYDLNFKIDRVKLAEVKSGVMINSLCTNVKLYKSYDSLKFYLNEQPNKSIMIIGLDHHTGYIIKDSISFFLHSNYYNKEGVIKEPISNSRALRSSRIFMIGSLTQNRKILYNWLKK